jgi:hypothetical protein
MFNTNPPLHSTQNPPIALLVQCGRGRKRQYTRAKEIETLAIEKFKKNGKGVTIQDLISNGLAMHKELAREKLKYCREKKILFTPLNVRPQQYFPTSIKSDILNKLYKNAQVRVTGVGPTTTPALLLGKDMQKNSFSSRRYIEPIILQTLEGHVLPLLPKAPLHIHRLHFSLKIARQCYQEIALPIAPWNKGKEHQEIIGSTLAKYRFYANGTIVVSIESSNSPFKLENESDFCCLLAFLGQLRDRLIIFLADKHERIVPDIMRWELTQWDLNKDVNVDELTQIVGSRIQIRHACHLFRIYIKSRGKDTVCRVEQSFSSKDKPAIEIIKNIFSPGEQLEKQLADIDAKVDQLLSAFCNDPIDSASRICSNRFPKDRRCSAN